MARYSDLEILHVVVLNVLIFAAAMGWTATIFDGVKNSSAAPEAKPWITLILVVILTLICVFLGIYWSEPVPNPLNPSISSQPQAHDDDARQPTPAELYQHQLAAERERQYREAYEQALLVQQNIQSQAAANYQPQGLPPGAHGAGGYQDYSYGQGPNAYYPYSV